MATYNEIVYNLKNLIRGGITSDDDTISNRQLIFIFNTYRAKLIREDLNKGRTIDRGLIQDLGCVPVECVDAADCCDIVDSGTTVVRTTEPIPDFLEIYDRNLLLFVGTVDRLKSFQITSEAQVRWSKHNKYTSKTTRAFMRSNDNYLYIANAPVGIELINIQGIFESPEEAARFNHCTGEPCFTNDDEYPVSTHMIPVINEMMMSKDLRSLLISPTDETNNTKEDAGTE
jgi:hypothetical protein